MSENRDNHINFYEIKKNWKIMKNNFIILCIIRVYIFIAIYPILKWFWEITEPMRIGWSILKEF
ncbi:MAG: hypothetical protein LBC92_01625 [Rickettsiales bacterium]|nr:hypothetical protein [Rickettsiales bacterium]